MSINRIANRDARDARLAHAAGVRDALHARDAVKKAVDRLMEGMDAITATGTPDWRNRRESSMAALAYAEGRPIEMVWQVTEKVDDGPSLKSLLRSPATRETLRSLLAESEADDGTAPMAASNGERASAPLAIFQPRERSV